MSARGAAWLAGSAWMLTAAVSALSVVLVVLTPSTGPTLTSIETRATQAVALLVPLGGATVGALVAWCRPANPVGWLVLVGWLSARLASLVQDYARFVRVTDPSSADGSSLAWLALLANGLWVPIFACPFLAGLLFPSGRLPSLRWRPAGWAC